MYLQLDEKLIEELEESGKQSSNIDASGTGNITKIVVPTSEGLLKKSETLTLKMPVAQITFGRAALDTISASAGNGKVTIEAEKVVKTALSEKQKAVVGDGAVYNLSVLVGDKHVSQFNGQVTVAVPYTLAKGQNAAGVKVWYINDAGEMTEVECSYDPSTGMATFTTDHFSYYAVTYEAKAIWVNPFKDVAKTIWYYDAVSFVSERGLFNGTSKDTFGPKENMTRAMFVTVLGRLAGIDTSLYKGSSFTDVDAEKWYGPYIEWAVREGIVTGYGNSIFGTNDPITREQMANVIKNYIQAMNASISTKSDSSLKFSDESQVSSWAKEAVEFMRTTGLITGVGNNAFAPRNNVTRAEVATVIMRIVKSSIKN